MASALLWGLLGAAGPIGAIIFWPAYYQRRVDSRVDAAERQQCLDYLDAEAALARFQTYEADRYNAILIAYGNASRTDEQAMEQVLRAANRLEAGAREILNRRARIGRVPKDAMPTFLAWQAAFMDYEAWTKGQAAAVLAMSKGYAPHSQKVAEGWQASEISRKKAQEMENRLLEQLRPSVEYLQRRATTVMDMKEPDYDWGAQSG